MNYGHAAEDSQTYQNKAMQAYGNRASPPKCRQAAAVAVAGEEQQHAVTMRVLPSNLSPCQPTVRRKDAGVTSATGIVLPKCELVAAAAGMPQ
jgi:outer membrane PBP1 activator LpoA protein